MTSFHDKFSQKISGLKVDIENQSILNYPNKKNLITTNSPNPLHFWGEFYRHVPKNWKFPLKIGLRNAFYRYFMQDTATKVGLLKNLTNHDVLKIPGCRKYLNNYKALIKFMLDEAKKRKCHYENPTDAELNRMYNASCSVVFALSKNKRAETFSWTTHAKNMHLFKAHQKK